MKYGIRKPNIKKSIKARTTGKMKRAIKKSINPLYGKKGMGVINDPKKAAYNAVYSRSTVSVRGMSKKKEKVNGNSSISSKPVVSPAASTASVDVPTKRKRGGMVRIIVGAFLAFISLGAFSSDKISAAVFLLLVGVLLIYFGVKKRKELTE